MFHIIDIIASMFFAITCLLCVGAVAAALQTSRKYDVIASVFSALAMYTWLCTIGILLVELLIWLVSQI